MSTAQVLLKTVLICVRHQLVTVRKRHVTRTALVQPRVKLEVISHPEWIEEQFSAFGASGRRGRARAVLVFHVPTYGGRIGKFLVAKVAHVFSRVR